MSRVLVTGGAGMIGAAVVRRLLADPNYEVRVADRRPVPQWMREGCEVHIGDLRVARDARAATHGCSHVIHLASVAGAMTSVQATPYTLIEADNALHSMVIRAVLGLGLERFVYVSCASVFERAELFPTPEDHLMRCPMPLSAHGLSHQAGEAYCRAAHDEHGLPFTICRLFDAYGPGNVGSVEPDVAQAPADAVLELIERVLAGQRPLEIQGSGEQTRTLTYVDDLADGIVAAMSSSAGLNEDFNISAQHELTVAEIARIVWQACGEDLETVELKPVPATGVEAQRRWPSVEKADRLLDWRARIELEDGIAATVRWLRSAHAWPISAGR
ncbi:MAG TPA: NAD(P)-dependent oxidoreductase [Solirubrobacteraceae bacterium]